MNNLEIDGGKTPLFAPVKTNVKNDGGRKAGFAHVACDGAGAAMEPE